MLIEHLLIELELKKDSLKYVNNYLIEEFGSYYCTYKGTQGEMFKKITGLLQANSAIIESIENLLISNQELVDNNYSELLETEI